MEPTRLTLAAANLPPASASHAATHCQAAAAISPSPKICFGLTRGPPNHATPRVPPRRFAGCRRCRRKAVHRGEFLPSWRRMASRRLRPVLPRGKGVRVGDGRQFDAGRKFWFAAQAQSAGAGGDDGRRSRCHSASAKIQLVSSAPMTRQASTRFSSSHWTPSATPCKKADGIADQRISERHIFQQRGDMARWRGINRFGENQRTGRGRILQRLVVKTAGVLHAAGLQADDDAQPEIFRVRVGAQAGQRLRARRRRRNA